MNFRKRKLLAVLVFFFLLFFVTFLSGTSGFDSNVRGQILGVAVWGMLAIFLRNVMGNYTGRVSSWQVVDKPTPAFFVEIVGWLLLVGSFFFAFLIKLFLA